MQDEFIPLLQRVILGESDRGSFFPCTELNTEMFSLVRLTLQSGVSNWTVWVSFTVVVNGLGSEQALTLAF